MLKSDETVGAVKKNLRMSSEEAKRVTRIVMAGLKLCPNDGAMAARWIARPMPEIDGRRPIEMVSDEDFELLVKNYLSRVFPGYKS